MNLRFRSLTAKIAGAAVVIMHSRGTSQSMYAEAVYDDVVNAVVSELGAGVTVATDADDPATRSRVGQRLPRCPSDPGQTACDGKPDRAEYEGNPAERSVGVGRHAHHTGS